MIGLVITIFAALLIIGGVILIAAADDGKAFGVIPALLGVAILAFTCTTVVPARTVGVKVAFGKPVGVVESGLHVKAPWTSVEKLDLAVQNTIYNGDNSIDARLANSAKARVDASIQWQLKPEGAEATFLDYRTFESIQSNLVDRNFRAALNEVMANFDPLATAKDDDSDQLAELANEVRDRVAAKIGKQVDVRSVTIPIVNFDDPTQNRINELQSEFARTRIAQQKQETAKAESEANRQLDASLNANVLTSKCLDIVAESGQSPLGCFGGSAAPVVDVAKK